MKSFASRKEEDLRIQVGRLVLRGDLAIPAGASGLVIFAHGSGSGRKSSRNRFVARALQQERLGTLLFDLLTEEEERTDARDAKLRFDIRLLANRLRSVAETVLSEYGEIPIGFFGASTGAAAALIAAAELGSRVHAVVSRGGRPDLAGPALGRVAAPTLLIVGGEDHVVIDLNEEAYVQLAAEKKLVIVPGATHLFEEPGTLDQVASLAAGWFTRVLGARTAPFV